jgi:hypothetical protein
MTQEHPPLEINVSRRIPQDTQVLGRYGLYELPVNITTGRPNIRSNRWQPAHNSERDERTKIDVLEHGHLVVSQQQCTHPVVHLVNNHV